MCSEDGLCLEMMVSVQRGWFTSGEDGTCIERSSVWRGYPYIDGPRTKIMMYIEMNG